jgi:hypothetical protein
MSLIRFNRRNNEHKKAAPCSADKFPNNFMGITPIIPIVEDIDTMRVEFIFENILFSLLKRYWVIDYPYF